MKLLSSHFGMLALDPPLAVAPFGEFVTHFPDRKLLVPQNSDAAYALTSLTSHKEFLAKLHLLHYWLRGSYQRGRADQLVTCQSSFCERVILPCADLAIPSTLTLDLVNTSFLSAFSVV